VLRIREPDSALTMIVWVVEVRSSPKKVVSISYPTLASVQEATPEYVWPRILSCQDFPLIIDIAPTHVAEPPW
jgi:hypothetical protein